MAFSGMKKNKAEYHGILSRLVTYRLLAFAWGKTKIVGGLILFGILPIAIFAIATRGLDALLSNPGFLLVGIPMFIIVSFLLLLMMTVEAAAEVIISWLLPAQD